MIEIMVSSERSTLVRPEIYMYKSCIKDFIKNIVCHTESLGDRAFFQSFKQVIVEVYLVNNSAIKRYNHKFLQRNEITDVISLQFYNTEELEAKLYSNIPLHLGMIIVSVEYAKHACMVASIDLRDYLLHLVLHGFLHLLGYDHSNDNQADQMIKTEIKLLHILGINCHSLSSTYWNNG